MEYIDQIKKGDPTRNGTVTNPDKIIKMQVAADAEKSGESLSRPVCAPRNPCPLARDSRPPESAPMRQRGE